MSALTSVIVPWGLATTLLALKLNAVLDGGRILIARRQLRPLSAFVAAWLLVIVVQTAIMLLLSSFGMLQRWSLMAAYVLAFALVRFWASRSCSDETLFHQKQLYYLPAFSIAIVLVAVWIRAALLFDSTWDGQAYGLPRLILWMQAKSVFHYMDAPQLNLFTNEWIAELNMLSYGIWADAYVGFNFGNLELLVVLAVGAFWIMRLLKADSFVAQNAAALILSLPAVLGLAVVAKGDLLACVGACLSLGWLLQILQRSLQSTSLCFLSLSCALTCAAKISVAITVAGIFSAGIAYLAFSDLYEARRKWKSLLLKCALTVAGVAILLSRFWLNWWIYGEWFKRIDQEKATFSYHNIEGNVGIALKHIFGASDVAVDQPFFALSAGFGLAAWFLGSLILVFLGRRIIGARSAVSEAVADPLKPSLVVAHSALALLIFLTMLLSMGLGTPYPWTFRYFLPAVILLFLICCAVVMLSPVSRAGRILVGLMSVSVIIVNLALTTRAGEFFVGGFLSAVERAAGPTTVLQRAASSFPFLIENTGVYQLGLDGPNSVEVLAYQQVDTALLPLMGSRAQNYVVLSKNGERLFRDATESKWDVVSVARTKRDMLIGAAVRLRSLGYTILLDNELYIIAVPNDRLGETIIAELKELTWRTFGVSPAVQFADDGGYPRIQSEQAVDAGFVSQPVSVCGFVKVVVRVEGEVSSDREEAAHVSLHGQTKLLAFKRGRYDSREKHEAILHVECGAFPLSFGLGGWGTGHGHLRLVSLELAQLNLSSPLMDNLSVQRKK